MRHLLFILLFLLKPAALLAGMPAHDFEEWTGTPLELNGAWQVEAGLSTTAETVGTQRLTPINRTFTEMSTAQRPLQGQDAVTFFLHLHNLPAGDYGLRLRVDTAATVLARGPDGVLQTVLQIGRVGTNKAETIPEIADPLGLLHASIPGDYTLIVQVANFHYPNGIVWRVPTIGSYRLMKSDWIFELVIEAFCFGIIAILGIYNIALFLNRREDQSNLWLAGYCVFAFLRFIGMSAILLPSFFPEPSVLLHAIARKCEIGMPAISAACLTGFACYNFRRTARFTKMSHILLSIGGLFALLCIGLDTAILPYMIPLLDVILIGCFATTLWITVRAVGQQSTGSLTFLLGILTFGILASYDIAVGLHLISSRYYLSSLGLVIFIFCQGQVVAKLFAKAFRTAERLTEHLEEEVAHKTRDITTMLNNIPLGICSLDQEGRVMPSFSSHLPDFIGTDNPAGRPFLDILFSLTKLNGDQKDLIEQSLMSMLGESILNYQINAQHLPEELTFIDGKHVQFIWTPQLDRQDQVQSLMVILRDVTQLKKSELERISHQKELEYIIEIVNVSQEKFQAFMDSSFRFLAENDRLLRQNNRYDPEIIKIIFVNMHTMKGAARTLGLNRITSLLHEIEHDYSELLKNPAQTWDNHRLCTQMDEAKALFDYYLFLNHEKLGRQSLSADRIQVERSLIEAQNLALRSIRRSALPPADAAIIHQAISTLEDLCFSNASDVFLEILSNVHKVAKDLGKEQPTIEVEAEGFKLNREAREVLSHVFVHIIRNSLDHGIESADERVGKGKRPTGRIQIHLTKQSDDLLIQYTDDGRGLHVKALIEKGRSLGLLRPDQNRDLQAIGNLIFVSGVSTARALTEVSGRGVGMDAVRRYLEEKGGSIQLELGEPVDGFAPFKLNLTLRGELFVTQDVGTTAA